MRGQGQPNRAPVPIRLTDYLALVDWTGRALRVNKRGVIPPNIRPVLQKLGVQEDNWVTGTQQLGRRFYRALGRTSKLKRLADRTGLQWIHGMTQANAFYL